jgi:hypothetical protein
MKILISISATALPVFKKGNRVLVKVENNAWYSGTLTSAGKKLQVTFDDGDKATIEAEDFKLVKILLTTKAYKRTLSNVEAKTLYTPAKVVKTDLPLTPKEKAKVTKVETAKVVLAPVKPLPANVGINPDRKGKQVLLDLYEKCGDAELFTKASSPAAKLFYLKTVYRNANQHIFGDRLAFPTIYLMKVQKTTSFRGRGVWKPGRRELGVSPRLFNAGEAHVLSTFIHEMCHQAVSELDKVNDRTAGGHGPNWTAWMHKTGIPAARYDATDHTEYMTDAEKNSHVAMMDDKALAIRGQTPISYPRKHQAAMFYTLREKKWMKGVVSDITRKGIIFVASIPGSSWSILPPRTEPWLYELPEGERSTYETPEWRQAADNALTNMAHNTSVRSIKRNMKKTSWF